MRPLDPFVSDTCSARHPRIASVHRRRGRRDGQAGWSARAAGDTIGSIGVREYSCAPRRGADVRGTRSRRIQRDLAVAVAHFHLGPGGDLDEPARSGTTARPVGRVSRFWRGGCGAPQSSISCVRRADRRRPGQFRRILCVGSSRPCETAIAVAEQRILRRSL